MKCKIFVNSFIVTHFDIVAIPYVKIIGASDGVVLALRTTIIASVIVVTIVVIVTTLLTA